MQAARIRVDENGGLLIPSLLLKALRIEAGDEVILQIENGELRITTQWQRIRRAQRRARQYVKPGISLVDELLAERKSAKRGQFARSPEHSLD
jgi:antitoxin component of MazEF toxin-antitoxin module